MNKARLITRRAQRASARSWPAAFVLLGALLAPAGAVIGAEPGSEIGDPRKALAVEVVKSRADEVAASTALDEATRAALAELYRKTIANLENAKRYREATERYEHAIAADPGEAERLRRELEARSADVDQDVFEPVGMSLAEVEQLQQREQAGLTADEARLAAIKDTVDEQQARPAVIRQRLSATKIQIAELEADEAVTGAADEPPDLVQARRWAREARLELLRAEILMLEQELASLPMRLDLLRVQQDLSDFNLQMADERVQGLQRAANDLRLDEAKRAKTEAEEAEREARSKHPLVAELAARNARLGAEVDTIAGAIEGINQEQEKASEEAKRLEETLRTTQQKIELAGLSQILGQVLQEQRRTLPNTASFKKSTRERERRIAETALSQIQLEEERTKLRNIPAYVGALTAALGEDERARIADELQRLAKSRQAQVEKALSIQRTYLRDMGELDFAQRRLADVVARFDAFLDKRLLWVRSTHAAGLETMMLIPGQVADLLDSDKWRGLLRTLAHESSTSGWIVLALLAAIAIRAQRRRLLAALEDSGRNVGVIKRDRLGDSLRGIGIVLLLAVPWPLVMFVVGRVLNTSLDAADFVKHFGKMLTILAPLALQLLALRLFVAPKSIADVHFGWRDIGLQRLHADVGWFAPSVIVTAGLTILSLSGPVSHAWGGGLGRVLFLLLMGIFAAFFYRLTHPTTGTLSVLFAHSPESRAVRLRHLWVLLLVGMPLISAGVALAGFMFTAGTLIGHILDTAWFALFVLIVHQLIVRWLVLNQRKLRLQALRAKRQAEQEARGAKESSDEGEAALARDIEEPQVDFKALDATSRRLTNNAMLLVGLLGIWAIWKDMLPALGILDDVTLWTYTKSGIEGEIPITLASIGLALLILFGMIAVTRQLPAFLEIVLLQRLNMTQGGRYTVRTLTNYTIVAVGVSWIFSILGGTWSEIQWIFAALGVGIGFGLQEIVANFISGLIILFERPIRVGDVVTVGNTDGVVTRIRIRATTIRNWDRKELLVPNKNFITQELLNWSLSDQTTRIVINIGIAYGSDVERAMKILETAATGHTRVMKDPPPFVFFEQFGDNALMLSLRCFIDDIDFRLRTINDLNLAINRGMAEAGIEIAFPQRDLHLDTPRPLDIRIRRGAPEGGD